MYNKQKSGGGGDGSSNLFLFCGKCVKINRAILFLIKRREANKTKFNKEPFLLQRLKTLQTRQMKQSRCIDDRSDRILLVE